MAKMMPSSAPDFHGSKGEERLYQALRTLPDHITVIHSLRWIHPGNARFLARDIGVQGEGDFVIFDPSRGLLVIEVKGGKVWCSHGEWHQQNRMTGETKRVNPEAQASNTLHRLREELIKRVPQTEALVFGHAVWFPDGEVSCDRLPVNYNSEMTFDLHEVAEPAVTVSRAFNFWAKALNRRSKPLPPEVAKKVLEVLAPSLSIVRSVRQTVGDREERLVQLTQEQAGIVRFLDEQAHAAVHGAAGTGKTLVAVEKARRIATPQEQVLFLCYNSPLQHHLATHHAQPNVEYLTFHGLVRKIMGAGGDLDAATERFLEYLADGKPLPFDHVIVDEAQDLSAYWLELLRDRFRDGCFYVFYDRYQAVQGDKDVRWVDDLPCRLVLTKNCRNTDQVAKFAYRAAMRGLSPTMGAAGPKPKLHVAAGEQAAFLATTALVGAALTRHKLSPRDIAILPLDTGAHGVWATGKIAGVATADRPTDGCITVATPRRFKGLEAALVIIPDADFRRAVDPEWRRLLYIAASRARQAVHVFSSNAPQDLRAALQAFAETDRVRPTWQSLCRQLGLDLVEGEDIDPFDEPRAG